MRKHGVRGGQDKERDRERDREQDKGQDKELDKGETGVRQVK